MKTPLHSIPPISGGSFAVQFGDHLRSGIICGPFWGSFAVWGSFPVGDHLRRCTDLIKTFSRSSRLVRVTITTTTTTTIWHTSLSSACMIILHPRSLSVKLEKNHTVESRFREPPGETQIGLRNREFEKSKVASNYA